MHLTDEVADGRTRTLKARPAIRAAFVHRRCQNIADRGLRIRYSRIAADPGHGRHRGYRFGNRGEVYFMAGFMAQDLDQALIAALVVNRARNPDRLVRGAKMRVAGNLGGDGPAKRADLLDIAAGGRLGQFPPDMELLCAFSRAPAAFDDKAGLAQMLRQIGKLASDIARIDIDHDRLHGSHIG